MPSKHNTLYGEAIYDGIMCLVFLISRPSSLTKLTVLIVMFSVIEQVFRNRFYNEYHTVLVGGYDEPFYRAPKHGDLGQICYRDDYVSSALHEVAHWCIAGSARRAIDDYGYWYAPDGRDEHQQRKFEMVETKPQAIEWIFSAAFGVPFRVSLDNLDGDTSGASLFSAKVYQQSISYLRSGLPERAQQFTQSAVDWADRRFPVAEDLQLSSARV